MARPRILLVPTLTEVEWRIKPLLEEWAEVASYDAPGVGDEPAGELSQQAIVDRGVAEIERRNWDRCVVVGDEAGAPQAVRVAAARPENVAALALGHAALSFETDGSRAPINGEVTAALAKVARTDYRSYVRALTQVTQQAYDDEFAELYMSRVPQEVAETYIEVLLGRRSAERVEPSLRALGLPLLLVEHKGCLMWTREGFEDAERAFPDADTASVELKPSVNPEFAKLLKDFCAKLPAPPRASARPPG